MTDQSRAAEGLHGHRFAFPHEGRIRMILDGPEKGDWIGYCAGCDWQIGPRPVDPSLGEEVREHERRSNREAKRGVGEPPRGDERDGFYA